MNLQLFQKEKEMGTTFEHSTEIDAQMASKYIKNCLKSLVIWKMQIKITGHLNDPKHVYIIYLGYHRNKLQFK